MSFVSICISKHSICFDARFEHNIYMLILCMLFRFGLARCMLLKPSPSTVVRWTRENPPRRCLGTFRMQRKGTGSGGKERAEGALSDRSDRKEKKEKEKKHKRRSEASRERRGSQAPPSPPGQPPPKPGRRLRRRRGSTLTQAKAAAKT